jgi:hypothetical protein
MVVVEGQEADVKEIRRAEEFILYLFGRVGHSDTCSDRVTPYN